MTLKKFKASVGTVIFVSVKQLNAAENLYEGIIILRRESFNISYNTKCFNFCVNVP